MALESPKQLIIAAIAVTLTIFQLSRLSSSPANAGVATNQYALFSASSNDGFGSDEAAQDWILLRSMFRTRFGKFADSIEIVDARADAGTGARQLLVYTRPGAVRRCARTTEYTGFCLEPVPRTDDIEGQSPSSATDPSLPVTPVAPLHTAPLLLMSLFQPEVSSGVDGNGPLGSTHSKSFFSPGQRKSRPTAPIAHEQEGHRSPGHDTRPHPVGPKQPLWRRALSMLDRGASGGSVHGPARPSQGSSRGKAARAFGSAQRGPGLANRARGGHAGVPALALRLHVHIAGITCCNVSSQDSRTSSADASCLQQSSAPLCTEDFAPVLDAMDGVASLSRTVAGTGSGAALAVGAAAGRDPNWLSALLGALLDTRRLRLATTLDPRGLPVTLPGPSDGTTPAERPEPSPVPAQDAEAASAKDYAPEGEAVAELPSHGTEL